MRFVRCQECGGTGHFKCTKERHSLKVPINPFVADNLDEFLSVAKKSDEPNYQDRELRFSFDYVEEAMNIKKSAKQKMLPGTNITVPLYDKVKHNAQQSAFVKYGIPKGHTPKDMYCCWCGQNHHED